MEIKTADDALKMLQKIYPKISNLMGNDPFFAYWGIIKTPYGEAIGCGMKIYGSVKARNWIFKIIKNNDNT